MKAPKQRPEQEPERAAIKAPLRVGIISPYSFETPGGVQLHIRDFARHLMDRGHQVQVLAPGRRTQDMPLWVQTTGSSFSIPYNGSVANLSYFGVAGHKTRQWVRQGHFDIVHLHEPEVPSLSHKPLQPGFIPCPYVATFHAAFDSPPLALRLTRRYLRRYLASISQAIFVSPSAMQNAQNLLEPGIPSQIIPNGIETKPSWVGSATRTRPPSTTAWTSIWLRRPGEKALASCWSRPWLQAARWWPRTCLHSRMSPRMATARVCSPMETPWTAPGRSLTCWTTELPA